MQPLLKALRAKLGDVKFTAGEVFYWSPESREVFYRQDADGQEATWSLLHETGHALLGHDTYERDLELLKMEMAAWDEAKRIAKQFDIVIDEDHIQDCLDTYRDWLHARSVCPTCTTKCLQQSDKQHYRCHNCHTIWKVTSSRFARPYRSVDISTDSSRIVGAEI